MLLIVRTIVGIAGFVQSLRTYSNTVALEAKAEAGDESVEDAVALSPQGYVLGIPNGLLATAYFGAATLLSATGLLDRRIVSRLFLTAAIGSLGTSVYLVYQLLFVMRRQCKLCMQAHAINLVFTLLAAYSARRSAPEAK
jgi:uncharacterized membrane protein